MADTEHRLGLDIGLDIEIGAPEDECPLIVRERDTTLEDEIEVVEERVEIDVAWVTAVPTSTSPLIFRGSHHVESTESRQAIGVKSGSSSAGGES